MKQIPPWIQTTQVQHENRVVDYLMVQDLETLLYIINLGCIELNPFLSRVDNLANPDFTVIDLDPESVPFDSVIEVALSVYDILNDFSIVNTNRSF